MCDKTTENPRSRSKVRRCLSLGYVHLVLPLVMIALPVCLRLYTQIRRMTLKYYSADKRIQYWRQNKEKLLSLAEQGYKTRVESLGL
ncbi:MAG TPA: hypothetical protein VMW24_13040, partial [Sedimentisphaerales bacterium]|nr:hypothetical protein [Sedimentisphaerales bacterium]